MARGREAGRSSAALAIDGHVDCIDGSGEVQRHHPRPSSRFSGPGPVEAVTIHRIEEPPHWHLVTYGLSELHFKESPDRDRSGWGFELTFRVDQADAPLWAVDLLASLAAYVWSSRHPFAEGHNVDLRGPIKLDSDSGITAAAIAEDPALGVLDGPFGQVQFLQVVGLTASELETCRAWSTSGVLELLARRDPLLVTRLDRPSLGEDPAMAEEIAWRTQAEGSSLHELRVASLKLRRRLRQQAVVQMGAGAACALGPALRRELLASGSAFVVVGDETDLRFVVDEQAGWCWMADGLEVSVPPSSVGELSGLFDGRTGSGRLQTWPGLHFRVVK